MFWLFIVFAVLVGAGLPLQALVNARLGDLTAGAVYASILSVIVSLVLLVVTLVLQRPTLPPVESLFRLPAWIWIGGVVGSCYVVAAALGVPRIGAAGFIAVVVLGQMIGALLLDHYGVLHPAQPAHLSRILGAGLVMAGMILVLEPWRR